MFRDHLVSNNTLYIHYQSGSKPVRQRDLLKTQLIQVEPVVSRVGLPTRGEIDWLTNL